MWLVEAELKFISVPTLKPGLFLLSVGSEQDSGEMDSDIFVGGGEGRKGVPPSRCDQGFLPSQVLPLSDHSKAHLVYA